MGGCAFSCLAAFLCALFLTAALRDGKMENTKMQMKNKCIYKSEGFAFLSVGEISEKERTEKRMSLSLGWKKRPRAI